MSTDLAKLAGSFPGAFEFYHLGQIEPAPDLTGVESEVEIHPEQMLWDSLADDIRVAYRFHGDVSGVLVVGFEQGLDVSTYMELGNILAGKIATQLSAKDGLGVLISPPQQLSARGLERLSQANPPGAVEHKIYLHRHQGQIHSVHAFLIAAPELPEGMDA